MADDYQQKERGFIAGFRPHLRTHLAAVRGNFLGVAYRGLFVKGGRSHEYVLSRKASRLLCKGKRNARAGMDQIIDAYLRHLGSSHAISSLVLDRAAGGRHDSSIAISFGGSESTVDTADPAIVRVMISDELCKVLGMDSLQVAGMPRERVALSSYEGVQEDETDAKMASAHRQVEDAMRHLQETHRFQLFGDYLIAPNAGWEVIWNELPAWLLAIRALALFRECGSHWTCIPLEISSGQMGLPSAEAALVAIGEEAPFDPKELFAVRQALGDVRKEEYRTLATEVIASLNERAHETLKFLKEIGVELPKTSPIAMMPNLPVVLELSQRLVGMHHERLPLKFIVMMGSERNLASYYSAQVDDDDEPASSERGWSVVERIALGDGQFFEGGPGDIGSVVAAIQANGFILQELGMALYFAALPDNDMRRPKYVVQLRPFQGSRLETVLKTFTRRDGSAIALQVRERDARLYVAGEKVAWFHDNQWEQIRGMDSPSGLLASIKKLDWYGHIECLREPGIRDAVDLRLERVVKVVRRIAEREYGALLFLSHDEVAERKPLRTLMAPVWVPAVSTKIDTIKLDDAAAVAGLDGETYVGIRDGVFEPRQALNVTGDAVFVDFFEKGVSRMNKELTEMWETEMRKMMVAFPLGETKNSDARNAIYTFGTRHHKALRITWAYPHIIAISVSSEGPIRLWHRGIPVRRFLV